MKSGISNSLFQKREGPSVWVGALMGVWWPTSLDEGCVFERRWSWLAHLRDEVRCSSTEIRFASSPSWTGRGASSLSPRLRRELLFEAETAPVPEWFCRVSRKDFVDRILRRPIDLERCRARPQSVTGLRVWPKICHPDLPRAVPEIITGKSITATAAGCVKAPNVISQP